MPGKGPHWITGRTPGQNGYKTGCRCDECRDGHAAWARESRKRKRERKRAAAGRAAGHASPAASGREHGSQGRTEASPQIARERARSRPVVPGSQYHAQTREPGAGRPEPPRAQPREPAPARSMPALARPGGYYLVPLICDGCNTRWNAICGTEIINREQCPECGDVMTVKPNDFTQQLFDYLASIGRFRLSGAELQSALIGERLCHETKNRVGNTGRVKPLNRLK